MNQTEKGTLFRAIHQREGTFLIPNPWDPGSARILAGLGFEALATSSAAAAGTRARRDGQLGREEALALAGQIAAATSLPVSADLGNGFFRDPKGVAETVLLAAAAGLVGCSIEDATGDADRPLYDLGLASERVAAAAEAAHSLPFPFTLTARAETFLNGQPDLDETLRRLAAYEKAGADVLFAPGLPDLHAVRIVCSAVKKPVNFMAGILGKSFSVPELAAAGVKRISFAASLYRAAMTALIRAAGEVKDQGTFGYLETTLPSADIFRFFQD